MNPETREYVLFKGARYHASELAVEKVAAGLGIVTGIATAKTDLAVREGRKGVISHRFMSVEETVIHGGDLLMGARAQYDRARPREQTFQLVREVLPPDLLPSMIEMVAFDALIGNTDRHHDNWAVIRSVSATDRLAPAYDHGSSLGSHVEDDHFDMPNLDAYIRRGRSAIRWSEDGAIFHLRHLELLQRLVTEHEVEVLRALMKIFDAREEDLFAVIRDIPDNYAGAARRAFTEEILKRRLQLLREAFNG